MKVKAGQWHWALVLLLLAAPGCKKAESDKSGPTARTNTEVTKKVKEAASADDDGKEEETPEPVQKAGSVESAALWQKYHADPEAADKAYKGKLLLVRGKVETAGGELGRSFVDLQHRGNDNLKVRCYFLPNAAGEVEDLAKGMPVAIRGQCIGKIGDAVALINCHVQK